MPTHPYLGFCPYLPLNKAIEFAGWRLGPVAEFENAWATPEFKTQAEAFLTKFVNGTGQRIENPSLLVRQNSPLDGQLPTNQEQEALELALGFAFLDRNPRRLPNAAAQSWGVVTADNTEPYFWPIDLQQGQVVVTSGFLVRAVSGGWQISDEELSIRPPLELHMGFNSGPPDVERLAALYGVLHASLTSPATTKTADRLRVAIGWFIKAWRNTTSLHYPERIVFLKTAFEALTGTSDSREAARRLRTLFEGIPGTAATDSDRLVWSPAETPVHLRTYTVKDPVTGKKTPQQEQLTDLEHWFMAFAKARNSIIHDGVVSSLTHVQSGSNYEGQFFWTGEYFFRAVAKVTLSTLGHPDIWRSATWRIAKATLREENP